ncbi:hypothetical protein DFJ74DRAFT_649948 [Hyaloraphidium curvatum]|nr:hypothetical protein DFJ74DRAFT_649948 [Hyaloraphidium curvatum]
MFWKSELKQTVEQGPAVALDGVPSFLDEIKEMPGGRDGSSGVSGASKGLENALQAALRDARVLGEEIAGVLRLRRQTVGPQEIGDGEVQATVAELQDQIASWEARMKEALAMHEREQHERQDLHHRFRHLDEVRKAIDSANAEILYRHAHSAQQELQAQKERELEAKAMALVADLEVLRKSAAEEAAALRQRIREMEVKARQQRSKQPSKPRKPGWSCWLRTFRSSLQSPRDLLDKATWCCSTTHRRSKRTRKRSSRCGKLLRGRASSSSI